MSNNIYDILKKLQSLEKPKSNLTEGKSGKPDFIDVDKDGDKEEPMKKAVKDKEKSGLAEAIARVEARLMEKWDKQTKTPEKEQGKYKNKTKSELESMLAAVKKSGPHKKGTAEYEKQNELEFAIRAKSGWGKVDESESNDRPYVCVHAKKGTCEVNASSAYGAAKKAAEKWKLKSTAGIDAHLADVEHDAAKLGEGFDDLQKYMKDKSEKTQHGTKTKTKTGLKHVRDYDKEQDGEETRGRGRPKKDKFSEDLDEGFDDLQKYMKDKSEKTQHGTKTQTKTGVRHERDYDKEENDKETGEEKKGRGRPKKDKFAE